MQDAGANCQLQIVKILFGEKEMIFNNFKLCSGTFNIAPELFQYEYRTHSSIRQGYCIVVFSDDALAPKA